MCDVDELFSNENVCNYQPLQDIKMHQLGE